MGKNVLEMMGHLFLWCLLSVYLSFRMDIGNMVELIEPTHCWQGISIQSRGWDKTNTAVIGLSSASWKTGAVDVPTELKIKKIVCSSARISLPVPNEVITQFIGHYITIVLECMAVSNRRSLATNVRIQDFQVSEWFHLGLVPKHAQCTTVWSSELLSLWH